MKMLLNQKIDAGTCCFGKDNEYQLTVATSIEERTRAWSLVFNSYFAKGYAEADDEGLWYGAHDALPDTTTFLVTRDGEDVATMTLVVDSPLHMPADTLYREELDEMRKTGRRPAETISLASTETDRRRCMEVLRHLFRAAYLTARHVAGATDLIATVNPHHVGYYKKKMLFEQVGEVYSYDKVGGMPAVLLRLNFDALDERYLARHGAEAGSPYVFFCACGELEEITRFVEQNRQILSPEILEEYFITRRPLLKNVIPEVRDYIYDQYATLAGDIGLFPSALAMSA